jgi:hypothetical protein
VSVEGLDSIENLSRLDDIRQMSPTSHHRKLRFLVSQRSVVSRANDDWIWEPDEGCNWNSQSGVWSFSNG